MLVELAVRGLGVIDELSLLLGPGMTAVTGETGAGKTLVVTAIDLLVGGRADPLVVGAGHTEAEVEGRFVIDQDELVVRRVVPAEGRSRAYIDGRLATVQELAELGARAVDLHGQHAHQSLLATAAQRKALDLFAGIDLGPLRAARATRRALSSSSMGWAATTGPGLGRSTSCAIRSRS
jgi:DNA repair protein RecN (Recombination protein N)